MMHKIIQKEILYIKIKLMFVKEFEIIYQLLAKREPLVERIILPENRTARNTSQGLLFCRARNRSLKHGGKLNRVNRVTCASDSAPNVKHLVSG